jgi:hypothetical protein
MEPTPATNMRIKPANNKLVKIDKKLMFYFLPGSAKSTICNPIADFINLKY